MKNFKEIKIDDVEIHRWIDNYGSSPFLINSLVQYAEKRKSCGGALTALLENDLRKFMSNASKDTLNDLDNLFKFVYNVLPGNCWGNTTKVQHWLKGTEKY